MSNSSPRMMFEIEHPDSKLSMTDAATLLAETGIELDEKYGPILVNPKQGRYIVRGFASAAAVQKAKAIAGVKVFADAPIQPMRK